MIDFAASERARIDKTWYVDSADLDDDGHLDLMLALTFERPDPIAVFFGRGDGTFHAPDIYDGPDMGVVASLAADVDGDGLQDILIGNRCAATVIVLRGVGDRKFERSETVPAYSVESLAVDDLNLDGRPDLIGVGQGLWVLPAGEDRAELVAPVGDTLPALVPRDGVYINELMPYNRSHYETGHGETPDWVELFNFSLEDVSLDGWALAQVTAGGNVDGWPFPPGTRIPSGGHLVVFFGLDVADTGEVPGLICPAFQLSRDGETLVLLDPRGDPSDSVTYPFMPPDVSYARLVDAARYLGYNPVPTPGRLNTRPANIDPRVDVESPTRLGESTIALTARAFDDTGVAYAAVGFRIAGEDPTFRELVLSDDGRHGDAGAGDGLYGAVLPALAAEAVVEYYVRVVDLEGGSVTRPSEPESSGDL